MSPLLDRARAEAARLSDHDLRRALTLGALTPQRHHVYREELDRRRIAAHQRRRAEGRLARLKTDDPEVWALIEERQAEAVARALGQEGRDETV